MQRTFYRTALEESQAENTKAYIFHEEDRGRIYHFLQLLQQHQIEIYQAARDITVKGKLFPGTYSYIVPLGQKQHRLIKAMFETRTQFKDSLFYDVSAWTLPLAFNLEYEAMEGRAFSQSLLGNQVQEVPFPSVDPPAGTSTYGYAFEWHEYYAPRALYRLLSNGLLVKVATDEMLVQSGLALKPGSILIPVAGQKLNEQQIYELMQTIAKQDAVTVKPLSTGYNLGTKNWGSPTVESLKPPKVLLLAGEGVSSYETGEVWHLLDQRMHMPFSMVDTEEIDDLKLHEYNIMIMPSGQYKKLSNHKERIKQWVLAGGTLISWKTGAQWLAEAGISNAKIIQHPADSTSQLAYGAREQYDGAREIGGAIFKVNLDSSHPLAYGITRPTMAVFRNSDVMIERGKNPFVNPIMYSENPLISGYIHPQKLEKLKKTAGVNINHLGSGKVIVFADNPNFRAFWLGTNKLFLNALFFGPLIESKVIK